MKRIHLFLLIAILFCGCKDKNAPTQIVVDFEYKRLSPLIVQFTNHSIGCDSYKWDFGDGSWANGTDAYYCYEKTGTYNVTLTATADGKKYEKRVTINLTKPTIWIAGFTLYKIPYENRYYKLSFKDDALLPSSWDFFTIYTPLLDNTDMPYTYMFNNPRTIDNPESHDYWNVILIRTTDASNDNNDVKCMTGKLTKKDLLEYKQEYIWKSESGATAFSVQIRYSY